MIRMLDPYAVARPEWVGAGELYRMQLREGRGAAFGTTSNATRRLGEARL